MKKPALVNTPIAPLLANRWSPRAFDEARDIDSQTVAALCEAARWTPSCFGAQPWFFVVCDRARNRAAWEKAVDCLMPANAVWARRAALLAAVCAAKNFDHNQKPNRHSAYDAGAAAFAFVLQAEAAGLRAHQMAGFDGDKARAAFSIPPACECLAFVAVGWQAAAETIDNEDLRQRETAARERKPLAENFFDGAWDKSVSA